MILFYSNVYHWDFSVAVETKAVNKMILIPEEIFSRFNLIQYFIYKIECILNSTIQLKSSQVQQINIDDMSKIIDQNYNCSNNTFHTNTFYMTFLKFLRFLTHFFTY